MNANQIVSRMNTYIHTSATLLAGWLGRILPKTSDGWWDDCVLSNLSYNQRQIAQNKGYTRLEEFDLAALLRIADKSWYEMRSIRYLPTSERECIRDMMRVRNNWAHLSADLPGKDVIVADLQTVLAFYEQLGADIKDRNEIDRMIEDVKLPSNVDFSAITSADEVSGSGNTSTSKNTEGGTRKPSEGAAENDDAELIGDSDEIEEKTLIYLVGDPSVTGVVMSVKDLDGTKRYEVFVNGNFKTFYAGQIAPVVQEEEYNWVDVNTFRSYLTAYQINNPSCRDLYSLNSARIDFVPYQFRPALKIIHSDEPRILIADSVGVGKTIEAGLIIKELQARNDMENILIICPKPLVTERKWELEMKRFDEDFIAVNGQEFRQIISDTDRDGEWPVRYNKTIVPYSVLDSRTYNGINEKNKHSYGLIDLDPAPHFDLVIVDEAHHIRNGSMEKEKAFEYKCVKYFCDHADAVVMLTATPLQTGNSDLYTLLNVLRPDVVIDEKTFDMMSRPNAYISKCVSIIRHAGDNWQQEALNEMEELLTTQWGENVIAANPAYTQIVKTLRKDIVTREERVKMITDVESLHSFHSMLNRTRRKDIQDFCIRRPYTLAVEFTPEQKRLHDEILLFEEKALSQLHKNVRSMSFMMTTIKRQAASCIFGLAPHIKALISKRFSQLEDDPDTDYYHGYMFEKHESDILTELAQDLLAQAEHLPEEDPKFDQMMIAIREKQAFANNKIIIFSTFRYTLRYLREKLERENLRVGQVDGSVKSEMRQELRRRFELPKENEEAIDILLFTEVGSEGLDYQFCNMMINYDLPWNPMKIEQRIGRIDRRGQESETVSIYNVITQGTVDADIYYRCLMRIGIFEKSIGECDEILGEIATQIDQIAMDTTLTDSERQIKLEQMADNEVRRMQELDRLEEEEKEFFGFDLSEYTTAKEIQKAENPWLTAKSLQIMIEQYLSDRLGSGSYILGDGDLKTLRLNASARGELRDDYRKLPGGRNAVRQAWDVYLKGVAPMHKITFDSSAAEKDRDAFFITTMHPLAKQAAAWYAANDQAYIRLSYVTEDVPKGKYHFSVYAWSYMGLNPHFRMIVICDDDVIAEELPGILEEAQSNDGAVKIDSADWENLEKKHIIKWQKEKNAALREAENLAAFKLETLTNNFRNKKRSLNQKIREEVNESIRRMHVSELEHAQQNYDLKVEAIKKQQAQTDIHTTLIANGILEVVQ